MLTYDSSRHIMYTYNPSGNNMKMKSCQNPFCNTSSLITFNYKPLPMYDGKK